jgi:hypothetical protein
MSDLNPTPISSSAPSNQELTELKEQCAQLQAQTHKLRIAQLIVALAVAGFFWVEVWRNGQALKVMRPQAAQVDEVAKKQTDAINDIVNRLAEFGRTHPDFAPILAKYRIAPTAKPTTPIVAPTAPKKQ